MFEVRYYKNADDYNLVKSLELGKYDNINEAMKEARKFKDDNKGCMVLIYKSYISGKLKAYKELLYACDNHEERFFIVGDVLNTFEKVLRELCISLRHVVKYEDTYLELHEINNKAVISNFLTGRVFIKNAFGKGCSEEITNAVIGLLDTSYKIVNKPIKSISFSREDGEGVRSLYFIDSKKEKGSIELFVNYF